MSYQESFFFGESTNVVDNRDLPFPKQEMQRLQANGLYLGTSSWKFRGWEGIIYSDSYSSQLEFEKNCFREYGELFTTVSLDATYYDWPRESYMRKLLDQVPASFQFCLKVTNQISMPRFPAHPRYGNLRGKENEGFLCAKTLLEKFWHPLAFMHDRIPAVILEFSKGGLELSPRLVTFLEEIPVEIPLYLEFRDAEFWNEEFLNLVERTGHSVVLHSYTGLPRIGWQYKRAIKSGLPESSRAANPVIIRALLPAHREKAASMEQMNPYDRIHEFQDNIVSDVVEIMQESLRRRRNAFVIIGNCLEGSAPMTVGRILAASKNHESNVLTQ